MMAALGSVGAGNNIALAFAPIMVMICRRLKLDPDRRRCGALSAVQYGHRILADRAI